MGLKRDLKQAAMQQLLTGDTGLPGFSGTWKTIMLGEIGMFLKGKGIRRDDVSDEGIACIRYGELYTEYNDYITNPRSRISRNVADTALPLKHGDLLFAGSGETAEEIGKCAAYLADEEAYAGGDIVVLRPSGQNSLYLGHHLNHSVVAEQKARLGQGDAVVHISAQNLAQVVVKLPPLDEQRAIATALSDVDALLEGLDRLIAKKRDLKQAAMQQLLTGETRLPGFSGEWKAKQLSNVLRVRHGRSQYGITVTDGQFSIWASGGEIGRTNTPLYEKPSVLIGRKGTIDAPRYVAVPFWTVDTLFYTEILGDNSAKYIYYRFCLIPWRSYNEASGVPSLNANTIENIEIELPEPDEQKVIAQVLSDMDTEIEALDKRRTKTADFKQAMMQELLTGKTRLVEPQVSEEQTDAAAGKAKGHNRMFDKAVVIAMLVKHFGKENYPLGRMRYTKLLYLLHRRVEKKAEGYLKKAAGPYDPQTKFGGPEKIAKKNGYIKQHKGPKGHSGFIAADNIAQAEGYFEKWYGPEVIQWLEKFRYKTNDDLERLTTVDMAAVELRATGKTVDVAAVRDVIASNPEWKAKLARTAFSDAKIAEAIKQSEALLGSETAGGSHA